VERILRHRAGLAQLELGELWAHRELLAFLAWRDVLARYKQTALGVLWAVIRPALTMAVFTLVFGRIARLPSNGLPYPLLVLSALLPWQYFSSALTDSSLSVVGSASLVSRVYFPRLVIPLSAVLAAGVDFLVSLVMFVLVAAYYGVAIPASAAALPALFLLTVLAALGLGTWFSALYVRYRDVRHVLPFLIQVAAYVSPVGYLTSLVPARWLPLYSLNPLVGIIDGFRWALLGEHSGSGLTGLLLSCIVVAALLVSGVFYFRSVERSFADVI
jgi:lipopolysaccharide transport system permease protein